MKKLLSTISGKILMVCVLAVVIPLLIVGIITVRMMHDQLLDASERTTLDTIALIEHNITSSIEAELRLVEYIANDPIVIDFIDNWDTADPDPIKRQDMYVRLSDMFGSNMQEKYQGLLIADVQGMMITGILDNGEEYEGYDISTDSEFRKARDTGRVAVGDLILSRATKRPILSIAAPILKEGRVIGVLGGVMKAAVLTGLVVDQGIGDTGYNFMISSDGTVLAHPNDKLVFHSNLNKMPELTTLFDYGKRLKPIVFEYEFNGVSKTVGYRHIPIGDWYLYTTQDTAELLIPIEHFRRILLIVSTVAAVVLSILAWWMSRRIVAPITNTTLHVKELVSGKGDLTVRIPTTTGEMGTLIEWFNRFLDDLQAIITAIKQDVLTTHTSTGEAITHSEAIDGAVVDIEHNAQTVSVGINQISSSVNNTTLALDDITTNINLLATASEEMSATINEITQSATQTQGVTNSTVATMSTGMTTLGEVETLSNEVSTIVETIDEISNQVNMLALNATIESARAGEYGKGFVVIANEIKELSRQTSRSADDIRRLVEGVTSKVAELVTNMTNISSAITDVDDMINTVATAVEEQAVTSQEITGNIAGISHSVNTITRTTKDNTGVLSGNAATIVEIAEQISSITRMSAQQVATMNNIKAVMSELKARVDRFTV